MGRLQNKVALVTGASAGIGCATAKLFAAEGARLVVGARRAAELASLVAEAEADDGNAVALAGDESLKIKPGTSRTPKTFFAIRNYATKIEIVTGRQTTTS